MLKEPYMVFYDKDQGGGGDHPEPPKKQEGNTFTQADVDNIVARTKKELKEQFGDYEALKSERQKLLDEKKEREQAEMSELEKSQARIAELEKSLEDGYKYKDRWISFEGSQEKAANDKMEELKFSEEDKSIVNKLPIVDRMAMINRLSANTNISPPGAKSQRQSGGGGISDKLAGAKSQRERNELWNDYRRGHR